MTPNLQRAQDAALYVIKQLCAANHKAYLAGGCVRDRLLGKTPKDYDVATDATPDRVNALFPRSRKVGAKFGVMLVRKFGQDIEVATFRSDGTYSDGRRPDDIHFADEESDARRRDFTINGMFFDPVEERVIDYVGGQDDLEAGIIRTIGSPRQRFEEDHLRMLRAVRFAARLGFTVHPDTASAITRSAHRLPSISPERIWMELEMLLADASRARGWSLLTETGLQRHLCEAWPAESDDRLVENRLAALPDSVTCVPVALAATLRAYELGTIKSICRGLRLSNQDSSATTWLVRSLGHVSTNTEMALADLKLLMAHPAWSGLLMLFRADLTARQAPLRPYETLFARAAAITPSRVDPDPLLTGDDLAAMGMQPGPKLGTLLESVRRAQLNEQIETRKDAEDMARKMMK